MSVTNAIPFGHAQKGILLRFLILFLSYRDITAKSFEKRRVDARYILFSVNENIFLRNYTGLNFCPATRFDPVGVQAQDAIDNQVPFIHDVVAH